MATFTVTVELCDTPLDRDHGGKYPSDTTIYLYGSCNDDKEDVEVDDVEIESLIPGKPERQPGSYRIDGFKWDALKAHDPVLWQFLEDRLEWELDQIDIDFEYIDPMDLQGREYNKDDYLD